MDKSDIDIIEKTCAIKTKIRYDEMDVAFGKNVTGSNVYVPINLTSVLLDLMKFKNDAACDINGFETHAAISILNIFAHYKHFFQTKNANHVIILGFVKDNWVYNKCKCIIDQVIEYCEFFPNIYMIPKILKDNMMYVHIVSSIMMHMDSITPNTNPSMIIVVSNVSTDRQLMCLYPTKCAYTVFKNNYSFNKSEFINKYMYMRETLNLSRHYDESKYKTQLEQMNVLLGLYFGKFKSALSVYKNINFNFKLTHSRVTDKYNVLTNFLENVYDSDSLESVSNQFLKYLIDSKELIDINSIKTFKFFESRYDFRYNNIYELNLIITPLLKTWRKKIKDYSLARESETYKTLISHQLFSNWLF